ncbi:hypothetical protein E4U17_002688 [Claviceps sp. LM77 group G4]|nr:hypothetical protein E4U17_002688 [Claviceps sp. LM77 group G4]KAG6081772.1 hypothetical protein E4U16_006972 [Claviceps sp. LM84 group G4]KAG6084743.1 hypothetical protein E4U33_002884 [Claviceps sp. LM78 group G4]
MTLKFITPTLKKASGIMKRKLPQRNWNHDSTLRSQFNRARDDWRVFREILDASTTEWNEETRSFDLSGAQRDRLVSSRTSVLEEAVANIFRDEPGAGWNIFDLSR